MLKEIVLQHDGKGGVDTGTLEDGIHICPFAAEFFWRTSSQSVLGGEALPLSVFQCVSYRNKKGGTIRDLFQSEAPPSTLFTNKHEQFTPKQDVNLHLLILVNFKLAVFRLRE